MMPPPVETISIHHAAALHHGSGGTANGPAAPAVPAAPSKRAPAFPGARHDANGYCTVHSNIRLCQPIFAKDAKHSGAGRRICPECEAQQQPAVPIISRKQVGRKSSQEKEVPPKGNTTRPIEIIVKTSQKTFLVQKEKCRENNDSTAVKAAKVGSSKPKDNVSNKPKEKQHTKRVDGISTKRAVSNGTKRHPARQQHSSSFQGQTTKQHAPPTRSLDSPSSPPKCTVKITRGGGRSISPITFARERQGGRDIPRRGSQSMSDGTNEEVVAGLPLHNRGGRAKRGGDSDENNTGLNNSKHDNTFEKLWESHNVLKDQTRRRVVSNSSNAIEQSKKVPSSKQGESRSGGATGRQVAPNSNNKPGEHSNKTPSGRRPPNIDNDKHPKKNLKVRKDKSEYSKLWEGHHLKASGSNPSGSSNTEMKHGTGKTDYSKLWQSHTNIDNSKILNHDRDHRRSKNPCGDDNREGRQSKKLSDRTSKTRQSKDKLGRNSNNKDVSKRNDNNDDLKESRRTNNFKNSKPTREHSSSRNDQKVHFRHRGRSLSPPKRKEYHRSKSLPLQREARQQQHAPSNHHVIHRPVMHSATLSAYRREFLEMMAQSSVDLSSGDDPRSRPPPLEIKVGHMT